MESSTKREVDVRVLEILFQTADLVEQSHSFIDRAKYSSDEEIMRKMELIYRYIFETKFTETHLASNAYFSPTYSHELGQCLYPPPPVHTSLASYWQQAGSAYSPIAAPTQPYGRNGAGPLGYNMYYPPTGIGYDSSYFIELLRGRGPSSVSSHHQATRAGVLGEQPYPGQLTSRREEDSMARPGYAASAMTQNTAAALPITGGRSEQTSRVGPRHQQQQHGFGNQSKTISFTDNAPTQSVGQINTVMASPSVMMMPDCARETRNNQIPLAFNSPAQHIPGEFGNGQGVGRIDAVVGVNEILDNIEVVIKVEEDEGEDSEENYEEGLEIEEA